MSIRFIELDNWKSKWYVNLDFTQRGVYHFMFCHCDNAGFFEINHYHHAFLCRLSEEQFKETFESLSHLYIMSNDGERVWLTKFLEEQKNNIYNPKNNAHKQIKKIVMTNKENFNVESLLNSLECPSDEGGYKGLVRGTSKSNSNSNCNSSGNSPSDSPSDGIGDALSDDVTSEERIEYMKQRLIGKAPQGEDV